MNKREKVAVAVVLACLVAVVIVIVNKLSEVPSPSAATAPKRNPSMAYVMAQEFIKPQLKAPSTADFAPMQETTIEDLEGDGYRVRAWVDAQNSFGAKLRNYWVCDLKESATEQWQVVGFCGVPRPQQR